MGGQGYNYLVPDVFSLSMPQRGPPTRGPALLARAGGRGVEYVRHQSSSDGMVLLQPASAAKGMLFFRGHYELVMVVARGAFLLSKALRPTRRLLVLCR